MRWVCKSRPLSTESAANLRLRFDCKILEGLSVYAGTSVYGVLPNDERPEIDLLGNASVGVQVYLLGKDKKYLSRRYRR